MENYRKLVLLLSVMVIGYAGSTSINQSFYKKIRTTKKTGKKYSLDLFGENGEKVNVNADFKFDKENILETIKIREEMKPGNYNLVIREGNKTKEELDLKIGALRIPEIINIDNIDEKEKTIILQCQNHTREARIFVYSDKGKIIEEANIIYTRDRSILIENKLEAGNYFVQIFNEGSKSEKRPFRVLKEEHLAGNPYIKDVYTAKHNLVVDCENVGDYPEILIMDRRGIPVKRPKLLYEMGNKLVLENELNFGIYTMSILCDGNESNEKEFKVV